MKDRCVGMRKSAAISVLTALISLSSSAASWEWYGLGSGLTSYFDDPACWSKSAGSSPVSDAGSHWLTGTKPHYTDKWDKRITFRNQAMINGNLNHEYSFCPVVFEAEKPEDGITNAETRDFLIYNGAELQINSGTYKFAKLSVSAGAGGGILTLNGGTLTVGGGIWDDGLFVGHHKNDNVARMTVNGGVLNVTKYFTVSEATGASGELIINGGVVGNTSSYLTVGGNGPGVCTIRKGGKYWCNHSSFSMIVGSYAPGTVNIEGGEVQLGGPLYVSYLEGSTATVNITDGGVLTMNRFEHGKGGSATLYLNGGTIRASADSTVYIYGSGDLLVNVGPNGATVDTAGHQIKISETFIEKNGRGYVSFVGGGVVSLLDFVYYSGATTVAADTKLLLEGATTEFNNDNSPANGSVISIRKMFKNGLVVAMPKTGTLPESGTKIIELTYEGTIPEDLTVGSNFVVTGAPAESPNWHLEISEDRKAILLVKDSVEEGAVLTFTEDTTHTDPVTASLIAVAAGKTASVTSSTSGALRKAGSGTLELTASRTDETVLTDGTLRFASGATVDPTKLKLGGDPRVPVTFDYGGQTLNADLGVLCGANSDVTLVNGTFGTAGGTLTLPNSTLRFSESAAFMGNAISLANQSKGRAEICKASGDWSLTGTLSIGSKDGSTAVFRHNGGSLTAQNIFVGNSENGSSALLEVNGGKVEGKGYFTLGEKENISSVRLVINDGGLVASTPQSGSGNDSSYITVGGSSSGEMLVKKGGKYTGKGMMIVGSSSPGILNIEGGEVFVGGDFRVCDNGINPTGNPATITVTENGILSFSKLRYAAGKKSNQADPVSPVVFNVDGGVIRANKNNVDFIRSLEYVTFNIGTRGAVFDNAGYDVTIAEDLLGGGTATFSGSGTTTLGVSQTGSGAISVSEGSTLAFPAQETTLARRVILPSGATLAMPESGTVSLTSGMTLFEGAVLKYAFDVNGTSKLSFDKALTVEGNRVTVAITGSKKPQDGFYKLTSRGGFAGKTVELAAGAPRWVRRVTVADDGNLEAYIAPLGFNVVIR